MKLKLASVALLMISAFASTAAFADNKAVGSGPNPYTDCGIGAALFPDTHWAAVSSNVIWDLGSTAVTSATMSPQTCSGKKVKVALFVRDTYEQLAADLAKGNGEHVAAAMDMFACQAAGQGAAISRARKDFGSLAAQGGLNAADSLQNAGKLYNVLENAAQSSCTI